MKDKRASGDDPTNLIGDAFAMGSEFPGPSQDLFLSWALTLGDGVAADEAAVRLLALHATETPPAGSALAQLEVLMRQAAEGSAGGGRRGRSGGRGARRGMPPG